jgi:hypothetical protein
MPVELPVTTHVYQTSAIEAQHLRINLPHCGNIR